MLSWLTNSARGACMGVADTIPGVSGGTLALILGIYERFIAALSAVGPGMLRAVFTRELWRRLGRGLRDPGEAGDDQVGQYASHILFLGSLLVGILAAIVTVARVIPDLLTHYPEPMHGFFFGLVLASVVIPYRMMRRRGGPQIAAFVLAAVATFFIVDLPIDQSQKATGEVEVTFAAPLEAPATLSPAKDAVLFTTDRRPDVPATDGHAKAKREVAFVPTRTITLPAGTKRATVPITASLAGQIANVGPDELVHAFGLPDQPGPATLTQPAPTSGGADPALWFIFIAGVIAISAMVLPGISGAFLLLMLGLYHYILFNIRGFVYEQDSSALLVLAVFGAAVVVGILTFARAVHWLLERFHDVTLAGLTGLMIGSLRKLWPFEQTSADGTSGPALPASVDATVAATLATFALGVAVVIVLDRLGRAKAAEAT